MSTEEKKSPAGKIVVAVIVLLFLVVGAIITLTQAERAGSTTAARAALDAYYAKNQEPLPPEKCRAVVAAEVAALADAAVWLEGGRPRSARPEDEKAQDRLEKAKLTSAEGNAFLARARLYAGVPSDVVIDAAELSLASCETAPALTVLGAAHFFAGDVAEAKKAYRRAAVLAPDYVWPRIELALVELEEGNGAAAAAVLDEVLAKDPEHPRARLARAKVHLQAKDLERARADAEAVTAREPENGAAFLVLGQALRERGAPEEAARAFCRAKQLGEREAGPLCPD